MQAKRKENNSSWWRHLANKGTKDIEKHQWLSNSDQINSVKINATAPKLADKFDHLFVHMFILGNIFAQDHGFDTVTVTISKYFISLH